MHDDILVKLNEMDSKLDTLLQWKAVHKESHKGINRDIVELRDTLFENPGLKSQVQTLMNCKHQTSRWRDFWVGVLKIVIATVIIAVLMWFMLLYQKEGSTNELQTSEMETFSEKGELK